MNEQIIRDLLATYTNYIQKDSEKREDSIMITKEEYRARVQAFARELLRSEIEKEILRRAAFERAAQEAAEADVGGIFEVECVSRRRVRTRSSRVVTVEEVQVCAPAPERADVQEVAEVVRATAETAEVVRATTEAAEAATALTATANTEAAAAPPPPRREAAIRAGEPEPRKVREKLSPEERQLRRRAYMREYMREYYSRHREEMRAYKRERKRMKKAGK